MTSIIKTMHNALCDRPSCKGCRINPSSTTTSMFLMPPLCKWYNVGCRLSLNSLRLGEVRDDQQDDYTYKGCGQARTLS